jgi:hypothetical protein
MFARAREAFSADELETLGARMLEMKKVGQQVGA